MLVVDGLRTKAGGPVGFSLRRGEIIAVRGPSGSGKSLMLRAIADLDPAEGEVTLDGTSRESIPAPEWRRRVGFVPAESGWWADRVGEHFAGDGPDCDAGGGGGGGATDRALIAALGIDPAALDWQVRRLSTGERQRLAIARALTLGPDVWLFDEPTAALDVGAARLVERVIAQGRDRGTAILLVTHDAAQAERLADRSLFMEAGRLMPSPPPSPLGPEAGLGPGPGPEAVT